MPPKVKITKNDVIQTALDLLRKEGESALNARTIASALNCSTQPIFSNFPTMDDLKKEVESSAFSLYLNYLQKECLNGEYAPYKAYGMAYIRFAKEEKELFKLLFMCDRNNQKITPTEDFESSVNMIMNNLGITKTQAEKMHFEMWICVHGIATMIATSFCSYSSEEISAILSDIYQGLRLKHLSTEN